MSKNGTSQLPDILAQCEAEILSDWLDQQQAALGGRGPVKEAESREQSREVLSGLTQALRLGKMSDISTPEWAKVRDVLDHLSRSYARQGLSASQAATFIFSLKQAIFSQLREKVSDGMELAEETWTASTLIDKLGLYTTEIYQKGREEIISRQQEELLELSTPVVRLWEGILALPLIGTLDSSRTQIVMENLLQQIVATGATIAIIDITGVPTVDTLVAQHLLKTVAAARLMGADCIISGIRPQIAQTIVHLGVELTDVVTKANLADAFSVALKRRGMAVLPAAGAAGR